jgi:hypothetical protein
MANPPLIQRISERADRLLTQQCLVRRFRSEHQSDFDMLQSIVSAVTAAIDEAGVESLALDGSGVPSALAGWFTVLEYRRGRQAVRKGNLDFIRQTLGDVVEIPGVESSLESTTELLATYVDYIDQFSRRFNYLDHCSLLSLSNYCGGDVLCRAHDAALAVKVWATDFPPPDEGRSVNSLRWLLLGETCPRDLDLLDALRASLELRCAYQTSQATERFLSNSVEILDYRGDKRTAGECESRNALVLNVFTDQAPADIDRALRYFRSALNERLVEEHGILANAPGSAEYQSTSFYRVAASPALLFEQASEIEPGILGLWGWDLTVRGKRKAAEAAREIASCRGTWGMHDTKGERMLAAHFTKVRKFIHGDLLPNKLDRAVHRQGDVRIGVRSEHAVI